MYQNSDLRIFSGNAHQALATDVCQYLDIEPGAVEVFQFSNENIFVRFQENIRGRDVLLVQPFSSPVNQNIMELLIMIDAAKRASAGRVTAVVPYYAYGRTDKKDQPRVPITGSTYSRPHPGGGRGTGSHRRLARRTDSGIF